ncbi:hypothetical protein [Actinocorallia herbida]|uniref:hypothetical protein n=1 Tax=Actinocorallia herbida TaxID=58109 RepID=UPI000F4B2F40|nr:hypothetical protein [Actinocorallia herbida]
MLTALRLHTWLAVLLAAAAGYPLAAAVGVPYAEDGRFHDLGAFLLLAAATSAVLTRLIRRAIRRHWLLAAAAHLLVLTVLLKAALFTGPAYAWLPALPVLAMTAFLTVTAFSLR